MGGEKQLHIPEGFKLERYLAQYEFSAPHLLCCSDCQPLSLSEVLALADDDAKQRWDKLSLAYTDPQGLLELRQEICKLYTTLSTEDVLVVAPQEGITLAAMAMLRHGDHVIATFPGYQSLYELARTIGCEVSFWEMAADEESVLGFEIKALKALMRPTTRAVIVNFPHNPSGALLSLSAWEALVEVCRSAGAYLFSDEMYRLLERDPAARLPAAADCYERGVSLAGMSKAFGMPGIRLGWLASRDRALHATLQRLHDYSTICNSAPAEILAMIGLRAKERLVKQNMELIESNLAAARELFQRHSDVFEFREPAAGSIAFPRLRTGEPILEFCERLVKGSGVLLLPATVYEQPSSIEAGHFRMGFGRLNFKECLGKLEQFLEHEEQGGQQ